MDWLNDVWDFMAPGVANVGNMFLGWDFGINDPEPQNKPDIIKKQLEQEQTKKIIYKYLGFGALGLSSILVLKNKKGKKK